MARSNEKEVGGWIGEAFERMEQEMGELRQGIQDNSRKLDVILQHLTGTQN
jgi:hypothetical protein